MSYLNALEKYILYPYGLSKYDSEELGPVEKIVCHTSIGSYVDVLQNGQCQKALTYAPLPENSLLSFTDYFKENLKNYLENSGEEGQYVVLCIGVACLQLFTQNNFCGPIVGPTAETIFYEHFPQETKEYLSNTVLKDLLLDTEGIYSLLVYPEYLLIARIVFFYLRELLVSCHSVHWWCCRYSFIHQKIAEEHSNTIYEGICKSMEIAENNTILFSGPHERELLALFHIEMGNIHLHYYNVYKARIHIDAAKEQLSLQVSFAGAMGKRTKWQEQDIAQLVLKVQYKSHAITEKELSEPYHLLTDIPKDIMLQDDTRLHKIKYKEEDEDVIPNLSPLEQMTLLAEFSLKTRASAQDAQLEEEMKSYLQSLLQHPKNWSIQLSALLSRSRIEICEMRAMERSMNQLEELVAAVNRTEPSRFERLKLIYASFLLPQWNLQQDLARMYMRLGCTKTALQIFERLQLWDDVIACYNELQMRQRSAELISSLLKKEDTPKLWCLMGEATDDTACFFKAWELSGHKSGRAQRCLGNFYYVRNDYKKAVEHFEISVTINTLQFQVWQRMAYCSLQIEDWERCAKAYLRCSILEPDSFECWNNMSQAYLKMDQPQRAWKALQEALRCNMSNWRLWGNYMVVSISLGYASQALNAYTKILLYKERHVDTEILGRIVRAVIENQIDPDGNEMSSIHKKTTELLAQLTREVPTNAELWFLYASMIYSMKEPTQETKHMSMQHYRKAVAAAVQKTGWEKRVETVHLVLMRSLRLVEVAREVSDGPNPRAVLTDLSSMKMLLRGAVSTIKKNQTAISTGEITELLRGPLQKVEDEIVNLSNLIDTIKAT